MYPEDMTVDENRLSMFEGFVDTLENLKKAAGRLDSMDREPFLAKIKEMEQMVQKSIDEIGPA